jgi:hypothetical protein
LAIWKANRALPGGGRGAGNPVGRGSGGPMQSWSLAGPEGQESQQSSNLAIPHGAGAWQGPRGWCPGEAWILQSLAQLGPGGAQEADSLVEWSSGSAGLWGADLAGWLFF